MTKKPSISPVANVPNNASAINGNLDALADSFDNTLSLDGSTPNAMNADLDLNSNDIINASSINADIVVVAGSDLTANVVATSASAAAALASETSAAADAAATAADVVLTNADVVLANKWAEEVEDTPVSGIKYSALHHANKAAASALSVVNLDEIATSKGITAVAGFVYDTSLDSDGGAWRDRCQHTSWYQETLNTATRGTTRKFPAVAVIIAEAAKITIYDGDDPALPMWAVWETNSGDMVGSAGLSSVAAKNGAICIGSSTLDLWKIDLIKDAGERWRNTGRTDYLGNLSQRNDGLGQTAVSGSGIVSRNVNHVALAVLPDAPIDPDTGLPTPTIAVATNGGVSVITQDGDVWDSSYVSVMANVEFVGTRLFHSYDASSIIRVTDVSDITADGWTSTSYHWNTVPAVDYGNTKAVANGAFGSSLGLTILHENPTTPAEGMVAYVTSEYSTGMMVGDIKGALLSSVSTDSLVGGTDNDRSVNANDLNVTGTITRTAVATGAELVGYSGFSASNYLEQPYNADLDFGTGAFSVFFAFKSDDVATTRMLFERDSIGTSQRINCFLDSSGRISFSVDDGTTVRNAVHASLAVDDGSWRHCALYYDGSGGAYIYVNGELYASATGSALLTMDNATALLRVGTGVNASLPLANGSIALLRIGATAPTADDIRTIYNYEKGLFQENAMAVLPADAVTALAYDEVTKRLRIGGASGMSQMQEGSLRVTDRDAVAVSTFISSTDNMEVKQ